MKNLPEKTDPILWPYSTELTNDSLQILYSLASRSVSFPRSGPHDYLFIGFVDLLRRDGQAAEINLQAAVTEQPNNPVIIYWLGLTQYSKGNRQQALRNWENIDVLPHILKIGQFFMQKKRLLEAWEWYQVALDLSEIQGDVQALNGDLGLAYRDLGKMMWDKGKIEVAIGYYENAVKDTPSRALFRYELAQLYVIQQRFDEAIKEIEILMLDQPESASWPTILGNTYLQAGRLSSAEQALLNALQTGNDDNAEDRCWHARAWFNLSIVYNLNESWESSLHASLQSIQVNQGINPGWKSQFSLNFKDALAADPERIGWYLTIGDIYAEVGDRRTAMEYYKDAAHLRPGNLQVQERLIRNIDDQTIAYGVCP